MSGFTQSGTTYTYTTTAPAHSSGSCNTVSGGKGYGPDVPAICHTSGCEGYYPCIICASDGTNTTQKSWSTESALKLDVRESVVPTVKSGYYPAQDDKINTQTTVFTFAIEDVGSGAMNTAEIKVWKDGTSEPSSWSNATFVDYASTSGATAYKQANFSYSHTFDSGTSANGTYHVKIRGRQWDDTAAGSAVYTSGTETSTGYTFIYDKSAPGVVVASPTEGQIVNTDFNVIATVTEEGPAGLGDTYIKVCAGSPTQSTVWTTVATLQPTSGTQFTQAVAASYLAAGANTVRVEAHDQAGNFTETDRTVNYVTGLTISNIVLTANPTDTGVTFTISAVVTEN